jgi:alkane 1-monooxygenase
MPPAPITTPAAVRRMRLRALRYTLAFTDPALAWWGLNAHGLATWALPIHGFALIPLLELFLRPDRSRLTEEEESAALADPLYDALLLAFVPVQWATLILFFFRIGEPDLTGWEIGGRIATMGLMCGVYGINIAHELGHRATRWERNLARALLLSSLYMHFIIEHNRGHHRHVATPDDPASARYGEHIYFFWARTIVFSFLSAWRIEADRLRKEGNAPYGARNEMIRFLMVELCLVIAVGLVFGPLVLLAFGAAALIGALLLETVNYIEHYGLGRKLNERGNYGRVQHTHSWNSDHLVGRLMLFELTRHSDHHYMASRKYQVLRSEPEGPQLPTGYPGMMILSLVPPLWFRTVDPIIARLVETDPALTFAHPRTSTA